MPGHTSPTIRAGSSHPSTVTARDVVERRKKSNGCRPAQNGSCDLVTRLRIGAHGENVDDLILHPVGVAFPDPLGGRAPAAASHLHLAHVRELMSDQANAVDETHGVDDIASEEQSTGGRDGGRHTRVVPRLGTNLSAFACEAFGEGRLIHVDVNGGAVGNGSPRRSRMSWATTC